MEDFVYAVTVIADPDGATKGSRRCWGFELSFDEAERKVLGNVSDLFEFYYNWAVIERMPVGVPTWGSEGYKIMGWYEADYTTRGMPVIRKCEVPDHLKGMTNFAFG